LVSTPHNTPLIMGDRRKNFEDPITQTQDIRKTKFDPVRTSYFGNFVDMFTTLLTLAY
jgi:hypothetical protein